MTAVLVAVRAIWVLGMIYVLPAPRGSGSLAGLARGGRRPVVGRNARGVSLAAALALPVALPAAVPWWRATRS